MAPRKMKAMSRGQQQLAQRRRDLHLHQKTVAAELGVSTQAVSAWENDLNNPELETLARLDRIYGGDGTVLEIFGLNPAPVTLDEIAATLEQIRNVVRLTYTVLAQIAEREGVTPPTPSTRSSDPPQVPAGRRRSD